MPENSTSVPAYQRIRQYVMSQIERADNPREKLLSVRALAKLYDVSPPTAMKALAQLLEEGVLVSRQGVGTFINPNSVDRRLGLGCVGLMVANGMLVHYDYVRMKVMAGIYEVLADAKLTTQHLHTANREEALVKEIRLLKLDGLIWFSPDPLSCPSLEKLEGVGIRVISIDLAHKGRGTCSVAADLFDEYRQMAEYLLERGHRQIVRVGQGSVAENIAYSLAGFDAACRERGLEPDRRLVLAKDDFQPRLETLIDLKVPFTALLVSRELYLTALAVLRRKGRRIPEDVSIITEDDHVTANLTEPIPTRVARPLKELGETAARAMIELINGSRRGPFSMPLAWRIIPGETCARVGKKTLIRAGILT